MQLFPGSQSLMIDRDQYMVAIMSAFGISSKDMPAAVISIGSNSNDWVFVSFENSRYQQSFAGRLEDLVTGVRSNEMLCSQLAGKFGTRFVYQNENGLSLEQLFALLDPFYNSECSFQDVLKKIDGIRNSLHTNFSRSELERIVNVLMPMYKNVTGAWSLGNSYTVHNSLSSAAFGCNFFALNSLSVLNGLCSIFDKDASPSISPAIPKFSLNNEKLQCLEPDSKFFYKSYQNIINVEGVEEFSPFCSYLHNILEIEINATVLQLMREAVGIKMPEWYDKFCPVKNVYVQTEYEKINLNKYRDRTQRKFVSPGFGKVYYALLVLLNKKSALNKTLQEYFHNELEVFINCWYKLFNQRNNLAHTMVIDRDEYNMTVETMDIIFSKFSDSLFNLKKDLLSTGALKSAN